MEWTTYAIAKLRQHWADGFSSTQIGLRLGCSKNAVVGKVHRLGLEPRQSPIIRDVARKRAPRVARPREYKLPQLPSLKPVFSQARICAPVSPQIPHVIPRAAKGDSCRMPLWGDEPPTHKYCGAQAAWMGCSWCLSCLQRVTTPEVYKRITARRIAA